MKYREEGRKKNEQVEIKEGKEVETWRKNERKLHGPMDSK